MATSITKMLERLDEEAVRRLKERHGDAIPDIVVAEKGASVRVGYGRLIGGSFLILLACATVLGLFIFGREMGQVVQLALLAFAAVPLFFGVWQIVRGSNRTSGEALDELKAMEGLPGFVAGLIRGRKDDT